MRIAVTYDNGNVYQHFGHTEFFKVYEAEDGKVISSEVIGSEGAGHEALAGLLSGKGIDVLICGGIGGGAQAALGRAGVEVCSGAQGNTDAAVQAYLMGELASAGVNCDHHGHEEGHTCGHHGEDQDNPEEEGCGSDCGSGCGGCGGGCGGAQPVILEGRNAGKTCRVHYRGTLNDGTQFDSSYDRGQPLEFVCGTGMMIRGFDEAVVNMAAGQILDIHLMPEEAYGEWNADAVIHSQISELPGSENLHVGDQVYLRNSMGQSFPVRVTEKDETSITLDANHEMAGKELNFRIELVEVLEDL